MPRPTLFDHPKFQRLVHLLQMPEPHVLGHLEYLWRVGYASGNPVIGDEVDVELCAKWAGERGAFVKALVDVRMLDLVTHVTDGNACNARYAIHDLLDNAPEYVRNRAQRETIKKVVRNCERCNAEYHSGEMHSRFCSDVCRVAHWRYKKAENPVTHVTHELRTETGRNGPPAPAPIGIKKKNPPPPSPAAPKTQVVTEVPRTLDTPEFREAWATWEQHRREIKKPLKPTGRKQQLARLAEMGLKRALAALAHSMANGWTGIFEPDQQNGTHPKPAAKTKADEEAERRRLRQIQRAKYGTPPTKEPHEQAT